MPDGSAPDPVKRPRFKPANGARAKDYTVARMEHAMAATFIRAHHYSQGSSNTSTDAFGLWRGDLLVGAALWLPPTKVAAQSVDPFDWARVVSLSRLAVAPSEPTNAESIFIGAMLRTLHAEKRWTVLLTYADERQGHEGTIYKATNWRYLGRTKPTEAWVDAKGRQVSKLSTKSRNVETMLSLGYRRAGKWAKHKYVQITPIGVAQCMIRFGQAVASRYQTSGE